MMRVVRGLIGALCPAFLAVAFLAACSGAGTPQAAAPAPAAAVTQSGPALWKVSDADSEVWLFGTIHMLAPNEVWRTPAMEAAFAKSPTFYLEIDLGPDSIAATQATTLRLGLYPEGRTLASDLSAEDQAAFVALATDFGLNPAALGRARPWLASNTLTVEAVKALGYSMESGADVVLYNDAVLKSKTIKPLETGPAQITMMAGLPQKAQVLMLRETMRQLNADTNEIGAMIAAWRKGDEAALSKLTIDTLKAADPLVYDVLITKRNNAWVPQLEAELKGTGSAFVAVGVGHLIGADGLPTLLAAKGFKVERVSN
jgi:hypothetical protein